MSGCLVGAFHPNFPAVGVNNTPSDGKAKAGTFRFHIAAAVEFIKQPRQVLRRDADTGIGNFDSDLIAIL
jgi:hypothetical protein